MLSRDARNTAWVSFDGRKRQEICHGDRLVHILICAERETKRERGELANAGKTKAVAREKDNKVNSCSSCLNTSRLCYVTLSTCPNGLVGEVSCARSSLVLYVTGPQIITPPAS